MVARRETIRLVGAYLGLAYGGSWGAWLLAGALRSADLPPAVGSVAGALLLVGTLMPMLAVHVLFPRLKTLGVAQNDGRPDADPRSGFWRHCFGMHPTLRGWAVFGTLLVWRWVMFFVAFGFPTLGAALKNAVVSLPVLLLGGGLEEIGWRGCLQPLLERWVSIRTPGTGRGSRLLRTVVPPAATGLVWGLWHLPLFAIPSTFQSQVPLWGVVLVGIALSFSFGALRRVTGNLDSCIASHAWYNAMLVGIPTFTPLACALFGLEAVAGALALWHQGVETEGREGCG